MRTARLFGVKRIAAALLGLLLLSLLLCSAFYVAAEAEHDCTGEDCPVCLSLEHCASLLRQLGSGARIQSAASLSVLTVFLAALVLASVGLTETPVTRKVRLNN